MGGGSLKCLSVNDDSYGVYIIISSNSKKGDKRTVRLLLCTSLFTIHKFCLLVVEIQELFVKLLLNK